MIFKGHKWRSLTKDERMSELRKLVKLTKRRWLMRGLKSSQLPGGAN